MRATEPTVEIRGLTRSFGPVEALGPIDLRVSGGAFVAVVGPSGCGKSTLLRMIAGLETSESGTITVDGRAVEGPDPSRGLVFQQPALFPWLTVSENIRFGLEEQGMPPQPCRESAQAWLEAVGIADFADAHPATLSGGMAQRAALARALAPEPALLLLDEPFGALDSLTRRGMQSLLEQVRQRAAATIVLVTHDVEEAVFLADRIVVMSPRPGRIVADLAVDLPHPRAEALRTSLEFSELRRAVDLALAADRVPG